MLEILDKSKRYVAAVSGGCDSMMLLALCVKESINVIAAFVNYGLRETAALEEQLVSDYCQSNGIVLEKLYPVQKEKDNFQKWARDVRYEFFREVYDRYDCEGLLTGHQKDDHLENFLMSKERGSHGWYYGIMAESHHHGMRIIRPLLSLRKKETRQWCLDNGIPFHDDESNFTDAYTRNKIRHELIETADDKQIEKWIREIEELNSAQKEKLVRFENEYNDCSLKQLREAKDREDLLRWLIFRKQPDEVLSSSFIEDCLNKMEKNSGIIMLKDGLELVWEYGNIYFFNPGKKYELVFNDVVEYENEHLSLNRHGLKIEGVELGKEDFPIKVRCWKAGDAINLRNGHKKVSRFLIDRKIPYKDRYYWPVIENSKGNVVFVSGIGCDVDHYSENMNQYVHYKVK